MVPLSGQVGRHHYCVSIGSQVQWLIFGLWPAVDSHGWFTVVFCFVPGIKTRVSHMLTSESTTELYPRPSCPFLQFCPLPDPMLSSNKNTTVLTLAAGS